jgi:glycerol-3-phosphate dehydrogenase
MYDVLIIGAGVVGAAAAYELSKYTLPGGKKLAVGLLEKENDVAMGTTKANSAIIHAGYDPPPGALMARLNVEGAALAKGLCEKLDVPHAACGSLVLAFDGEGLAKIRALYEQGLANGAAALELLDAAQTLALEPKLNPAVRGALYAKEAMIINPWEYALALAETAIRNGAELFLNGEVTSIIRNEAEGAWTVKTGQAEFKTRRIINAAGVYADLVHDMALPHAYTITPRRGEYYLLDRGEGCPVWRIIFQCPTKLGKGTLIAPTVHGNVIVGPNNAPPLDRDDKACTASGLADVAQAATLSVPSLTVRSSIRNFAGLRATVNEVDDFIVGEAGPGFFEAAGIKSPGLSAAPAIARMLVSLMREKGLALEQKSDFIDNRKRVKFVEISADEKNALIKKDSRWGKVICRCETVSEGEIIESFRTPIPPRTIDGVKRRCGAGLGRCQSGFCGPRVLDILAEYYKIPPEQVELDGAGSFVLKGASINTGGRT